MTRVPTLLDERFREAAAAEGVLDVAYDVLDDTPVGRLIVGVSDHGLCRIGFDPDRVDVPINARIRPDLDPRTDRTDTRERQRRRDVDIRRKTRGRIALREPARFAITREQHNADDNRRAGCRRRPSERAGRE